MQIPLSLSLSVSSFLSVPITSLYCIFSLHVCAELLVMPFEVCFCICVHGINTSEGLFLHEGEHFVQERVLMHLFVREF